MIRIGQKALKNVIMWLLAAAAFVAIFFLGVPFPLIILFAALIGLVGAKVAPQRFIVLKPHGDRAAPDDAVLGDHHGAPDHARPSVARALRVLSVCLLLWWTPVLASAIWLGRDHTIYREGIFFSKAAMVTFGGAYAVLPYVAQRAAENYGWLTPTQMLDGLGLAEATPGPLIMVVQFVGFVGGAQQPGNLFPLVAATLGALLSTWVTFVPCFLWILLGAPYIETLRTNKKLTAALSAITAAVVGVVLNLAVWFGLHILVSPTGGVNWLALAIAAGAFLAIAWRKWNMLTIIGLAVCIGIGRHFLERWCH